MQVITLRQKTTEEYFKFIENEPPRTIENKKLMIKNFSKFAGEKYKSTTEKICQELLQIKKTNGEEAFIDALYQVLQDWINWNQSRGLGPYSLRTRFSYLRSFLYFLGIKTSPQDVKQLLKFPRKNKEERYPLKKEELRDLVLAQARYPKRQALYLACSSSGMRIGEALSICKQDLDFSQERIMVRIRPEYTKTREGRTTFLSKECEDRIKTYLNQLGSEDLVFSSSTMDSRSGIEIRALERALGRLGYTEKYSSNNFLKITSHSFRAYFFTHAARKHGENYAHRMVGHGGYLMQYDRMTEDEKLQMYLELEPDLVVFDQTYNKLEIKKLKEDNETIHELRTEVKNLREQQAKQDKRILNKLRDTGILSPQNI